MSSSSTTQESHTSNTDMRVVGGADSVNLSAQNSTVSMVTTDHQAVQGGLALGTQAVSAAVRLAENNTASAGEMFKGVMAVANSANERVAEAYQRGNAGDQTQLKYAGFIVVGLAAVMMFKKG